MGDFERKDGDAVLYLERDKKNEKGPDWTGTVLLNGVEYRLAMWAKGNRGTMLAGVCKVDDRQQSRQATQGGNERGGFQRGGSDRGGFGGRADGGFPGRGSGQAVSSARGQSYNDPDDEIPFASLYSVW